MQIKPLGFYVLVEMEEVESVSKGGIVMPGDLIAKEQDATSVGYVRAIGPTAYVGYPGCDDKGPTNKEGQHLYAKPAFTQWGLEVGMKVEYRKFEGKASSMPGYENHRYIPDSHIIGAVE